MRKDTRISVIIPALNEEFSIGKVLAAIPVWVDEVIVVDNGSTDRTREIAAGSGARLVWEPRRGYGQACLTGIGALGDCDIVVFLDGDYSDYPEEMDQLVDPIIHDQADLVIGSRTQFQNPVDCFTLPQRLGTWLACALIRLIWHSRFTDLGPFRAIRASALRSLGMQDPAFGWTVEMQIKAVLASLRLKEIPVRYRKRIGTSKISGTLGGVMRAGFGILGTVTRFAIHPARPKGAGNRLLVFTRYPEPGKTKTRLIPAIGENAAADLQRRMTCRTLECAKELQEEAQVEIWFEGGNQVRMRAMFGGGFVYREQPSGDLGRRMYEAFAASLPDPTSRAVIVGADCPGISADILKRAFDALRSSDVVLGPATDGGYYLIGLRRPVRPLFEGIDWGTSQVRQKTMSIAHSLGLTVLLLDELTDVDRPTDLEQAESFLARRPSHEETDLISVIIPTYNEADHIEATVARISSAKRVEIIVADGGSGDRTTERAAAQGARIVRVPRGRARQMNAGARAASGSILVFLHADTRLPSDFAAAVRNQLAEDGVIAGAFEFRVDGAGLGLRLVERLANWRSRRLQMPYGDQAIFMRASAFDEMGRFKELPIMEDFDLVRRLKGQGRVAILPLQAVTSGRRWKELGAFRTTIINQLVIAGYYLGIPAESLARFYRRTRDQSRTIPTLPVPSFVGTRGSCCEREDCRVGTPDRG